MWQEVVDSTGERLSDLLLTPAGARIVGAECLLSSKRTYLVLVSEVGGPTQRTHAHMHSHIHARTNTRTRTHARTHMHARTHAAHGHMHSHIHARTCTHARTHARARARQGANPPAAELGRLVLLRFAEEEEEAYEFAPDGNVTGRTWRPPTTSRWSIVVRSAGHGLPRPTLPGGYSGYSDLPLSPRHSLNRSSQCSPALTRGARGEWRRLSRFTPPRELAAAHIGELFLPEVGRSPTRLRVHMRCVCT